MKKKPMLKVVVPVSFTGTVEVEVPADIPQQRRESLARKVALARVLATTENPDAPEDDACGEYETEFGLDEATAERNWDACRTTGTSGQWSLQADDDHAAVVERLADKAEAAGLRAGGSGRDGPRAGVEHRRRRQQRRAGGTGPVSRRRRRVPSRPSGRSTS